MSWAQPIGENGLGKIIPLHLFWHFDIFRFAARDTPKSHVGGLIRMYLMCFQPRSLKSTYFSIPHLPKKKTCWTNNDLLFNLGPTLGGKKKTFEASTSRKIHAVLPFSASSSPILFDPGDLTMGKDGQWTVEVRDCLWWCVFLTKEKSMCS